MTTYNNLKKYTNIASYDNWNKNTLNGSEFDYQPNKWKKTENTHNCYAYVLNQYKDEKLNYPQMGEFGIKNFNRYYDEDRDFTCSAYEHRVLRDNPHAYKVKDGYPCKKGYFKSHFVVAPNKDFHWYRQDNNGFFSHKPGQLYVRNYDSDNKKIIDPLFANRSDYKKKNDMLDYSFMCNSFCVPKDNVFIQ